MLVEAATERHDVQQVELADAHVVVILDDLRQNLVILLVNYHIDVDNHLAGGLQILDAFDPGHKRQRRAGQLVVQVRGVAVHRHRGFVEPGLGSGRRELLVAEHHPVGHGLDPVVAHLAPIADELNEIRVYAGLAARQDQPLAAHAPAEQDVGLERLHIDHRAVLIHRVETKRAALIAQPRHTHPVALVARGLLFHKVFVFARVVARRRWQRFHAHRAGLRLVAGAQGLGLVAVQQAVADQFFDVKVADCNAIVCHSLLNTPRRPPRRLSQLCQPRPPVCTDRSARRQGRRTNSLI